jgi:hypothetical protein
MLSYIAALLIILLGYSINRWLIKPMKLKTRYAKHFQDRGYKVLELPFKPTTAPYYLNIFNNAVKNKDPYYQHKHDYFNYDVIVTNVLRQPCVTCINPELILEITGPEKVSILHKKLDSAEVLFSIMKKGLVSIEGNEWRHRRKTLSKIFNFDFITQYIPMMARVADKVFDEVEAGEVNTDGVTEFKVDLFEVLVKYTSSIVIS